jgi:hypothetical protein
MTLQLVKKAFDLPSAWRTGTWVDRVNELPKEIKITQAVDGMDVYYDIDVKYRKGRGTNWHTWITIEELGQVIKFILELKKKREAK